MVIANSCLGGGAFRTPHVLAACLLGTGPMRDPEGDRARMQRRRNTWHFVLIFGSIVLTTIFVVILAKDPRWF